MSQAALAAIAVRAPEPPPGAMNSSRPESPARRDETDPILIPTSHAPAWLVGGVVLTALALAPVAGYYLLRQYRQRSYDLALAGIGWQRSGESSLPVRVMLMHALR